MLRVCSSLSTHRSRGVLLRCVRRPPTSRLSNSGEEREVQCNTMVLQGSLNPRNRCRASSLTWHPCCLARCSPTHVLHRTHTHTHTQRTSGAVLLQSGPVLSQLSEQHSGVTCSSSTQHCGSCCSSCCKRASGTKSQSPSRGQSAQPCWLHSVAANANDSTSSPCFPFLCVSAVGGLLQCMLLEWQPHCDGQQGGPAVLCFP